MHDKVLENNVIEICKNSNIKINPANIEDVTFCLWNVTAPLIINV